MEKKVSVEKAVHITPEYLIKAQYLDRSKFNYYGAGCSDLARRGPSAKRPKRLS